MDINAVSIWAKTSIPGIIFLGALGSILAIILLKIIKRLGTKLVESTVKNPLLRSFLIAKLVGHRYASKPKEIVVYHYMDMLLYVSLSFVLLAVFSTSTIIYFIIKGASLSFGGFVLLSLTVASLYNWLKDFIFYNVVRESIVGKDYDEYLLQLSNDVKTEELKKLVDKLPQ